MPINSLRRENQLFFSNGYELGDSNQTITKVDEKIIAQKCNINNRTVIQALGNIILIDTHLSSQNKDSKNPLN